MTPSHYVYASRQGTIARVKAMELVLGDHLIRVGTEGKEELVDIHNIENRSVPAEELVGVYTHSKTLIANNLYVSSIAEGDLSDIWHPAMVAAATHISPSLPLAIGRIAPKVGPWGREVMLAL